MLLDFLDGASIRDVLLSLLISLPVILLSLSFHEFGHAWVANRCGDPTARLMGRMTINPIKHLDPVGFGMMLLMRFGYAKPVPVNPNNFRHPRRDDLFVSIAGITCNLILAVIGAVLVALIEYWYYMHQPSFLSTTSAGVLYSMLHLLVTINLSLAVFNLLPIPPLDGYHVLNDLVLKGRFFAPQVVSQAGMLLLFALSMTGMLSKILTTVTGFLESGIYSLIFRILGGA